ncbi:MAG: hypothetical protein ACFFD5_01895 [Candidatus Thorarchaeota archaeon]
MEEPQYSKKLEFSSKQKAAAELLYIMIVAACIITLVGVVWSILDFISPTGKLLVFLELTLGFQIAIVAAFLAGLFFLLIFFTGLFKKGRTLFLRTLFKKKEIEEKFKNRLSVKIIAGGLLISLIAIIIGLVYSFIYDMLFGPEGDSWFSGILSTFTSGNWVLFAGILVFAIAGIALFIIYFWKNGYYLILKVMGYLESGD